MRPPEFTGGNPGRGRRNWSSRHSFNEAAGIHRRKRGTVKDASATAALASMRPPEFTGGNPEIVTVDLRPVAVASMRPPEFTGGNDRYRNMGRHGCLAASMRPPEFTGGNLMRPTGAIIAHTHGFNEAAGIHRRKPASPPRDSPAVARASMRPPEFTGGNANHQGTAHEHARALQ